MAHFSTETNHAETFTLAVGASRDELRHYAYYGEDVDALVAQRLYPAHAAQVVTGATTYLETVAGEQTAFYDAMQSSLDRRAE